MVPVAVGDVDDRNFPTPKRLLDPIAQEYRLIGGKKCVDKDRLRRT